MNYSLSRFASALVVALALTACSSTPTSRMTGEVVDDAAITAKVKTAIATERGLGEAASINVDTYRGVVSLAGFVNSREQIQMAENAAKQVSGVREVRNKLMVKPAS